MSPRLKSEDAVDIWKKKENSENNFKISENKKEENKNKINFKKKNVDSNIEISEEFEFSQDFVKPQADRRQLIRELMGNSVVKSRQIVPGGGVEELQLIVLPITHIIYNADNVRIRDKVLTEFELLTKMSAVGSMFSV